MAALKTWFIALADRTPYWVLYLALALLLFGVSFLLPDPDGMPGAYEFKDPAQATLDAVKSITTLVSALTTTLCAAGAGVAVKGKEWSSAWTRIDGMITLCIFLSGAVSYYGLYLAAIGILEMVAAGGFGLNSPKLSTAITIQYYALLAGYFLLGLVFCRLMEGRRRENPPK